MKLKSENMNHEQFITLETAKLAKQAGFDWEVYSCYYKSSPDRVSTNGTLTSNFNGYAFQHIAISAPTQSVLQRWLREVKGISVEVYNAIVWVEGGALKYKWCYHICYLNSNESDILSSDEFNTYEAALEAGLKECLTILIEKQ